MSPPVGVLLRKIKSGCKVDNTIKVAPKMMAVVLIDRNVAAHSCRFRSDVSADDSLSMLSISVFMILYKSTTSASPVALKAIWVMMDIPILAVE